MSSSNHRVKLLITNNIENKIFERMTYRFYNLLLFDFVFDSKYQRHIDVLRYASEHGCLLFKHKNRLTSDKYLIIRCSVFDDTQVVEGGFYFRNKSTRSARCTELCQKLVYLFPKLNKNV